MCLGRLLGEGISSIEIYFENRYFIMSGNMIHPADRAIKQPTILSLAYLLGYSEPNKENKKIMKRSGVEPRSTNAIKRAIQYITAIPGAISGSGGHSTTYYVAIILTWGFGLSEDIAYMIMDQYYNHRCDPMWSEKELSHKIHDAATKPHNKPYKWLLT